MIEGSSAEAISNKGPAPVLALTIGYQGAPFAGFARQPGQITVQQTLEEALAIVLRRDVEITGSGRTDAGVHARGQVVSLDLSHNDDLDLDEITRSLNGLAGPHVVVEDARLARPGFSARFDAVRREYRYRISPGPVPPVFLAPYAWWVKKPLDVDVMQNAAQLLIGEHDFRSFCVAVSARGKRTTRSIDLIEITVDSELSEPVIVIRIVGNAFLHSMVRIVVGSLYEIGVGRREPRWLTDVIEARERAVAGQTAPALGLTLWSVDYPEDVWL